jgi:hypothetical protein
MLLVLDEVCVSRPYICKIGIIWLTDYDAVLPLRPRCCPCFVRVSRLSTLAQLSAQV